MKIVAARFIPETVAECADMLALSVNRDHVNEWPDEMTTLARQWTDAYKAAGHDPSDYNDEWWYPSLLPIEDIRTLAIAYALAPARSLVPA